MRWRVVVEADRNAAIVDSRGRGRRRFRVVDARRPGLRRSVLFAPQELAVRHFDFIALIGVADGASAEVADDGAVVFDPEQLVEGRIAGVVEGLEGEGLGGRDGGGHAGWGAAGELSLGRIRALKK